MPSPQIICAIDCYPPLLFEGVLPLVIGIVMALLTRRWLYVPVAALIGLAILVGLELAWHILIFGEPPFAYAEYVATTPARAPYLFLYLFFLTITAIAFALKQTLAWILFGEASVQIRAGGLIALVATIGISVFAFAFFFAPDLLPRRMAERAYEFAGNAPARCKTGDASFVPGMPLFTGYRQPERAPNVVVGMPAAYAAFPPVYTTYMSFEHMLTRIEVIHVPDIKRYEPLTAVAVEVAVSESGQVLAIKPTAGPKELYPRAIEIASRWRFLPFIRDGKPVPARLVRMSVPIGGPELWGARGDTPSFSDWDAVSIKVEGGQLDFQYTLEIRGDGTVTYNGEGDWLALKGRHCALIPRDSVRALIEEIKRADLFSMQDNYESETPVSVTVALDDNVKHIQVMRSMPQEAKRQTPETLFRFVDAVEQAVHLKRWTKGDALTAPTLQAERWIFKPGDDGDLRMLSDVVRVGDIDAVRGLLALKVPVMTTPRELPSRWMPALVRTLHTPLEVAAARGAFDIVRLLLDSGIPWSADALGGAYVGAIAQAISNWPMSC